MSDRRHNKRLEDREPKRSRDEYNGDGHHRGDRSRRYEHTAARTRRSRSHSHSPSPDRRDRRERSYSPSRRRDRSPSPNRRHKTDDETDRHERYRTGRADKSHEYSAHVPIERAGPTDVLLKEAPDAGSILRGQVHTIKPFGVFVSLEGYKRHCLVHSTQVAEEVPFAKTDEDDTKVKALEFFAPQGQTVWVKILDVQLDPNGVTRVNGSIKAVSQDDGHDLNPTGARTARPAGGGPQSDEPPTVGSIHHATVRKVEPYGVFVQLDGFRRYGLVHSSQVSDYLEMSKEDGDEEKRAALAGVVSTGDRIWVKVLEVVEGEGDRGLKVSCSIKLVNQKDGQDLDPTGLRWRPRGENGGRGGRDAPIGADAGNVRAHGVVDWGHLKAGDKQYGGQSKQYAILGSDEEKEMELLNAPVRLPPPPPLPMGRDIMEGTGAAGMLGAGAGNETLERTLKLVQKLKSRMKKNKKDKKKKREKEHKHKKRKSKEKKDGSSGG